MHFICRVQKNISTTCCKRQGVLRDVRDLRDLRDFRDFRDVRDVRDVRDLRDFRDVGCFVCDFVF